MVDTHFKNYKILVEVVPREMEQLKKWLNMGEKEQHLPDTCQQTATECRET